ncbi:phosphoserine phosphatase SerB [Roseococcus suduntuyensis]|uniref:Phosphoserine phosphatase n=1 Tax=Roseococcus suduntuyensis TaxID=455361 RepID=A0A840AC87_9PROT|nr:phosphoserine phosphatase SerB [Roseococcus suduntuyensis]MBB3898146.1 phosphoserine phosphatase [Roseococcus suduntuyensis]
MPHMLTLTAAPGALTPDHLRVARAALSALGADLDAAEWLSEGEAVDQPFTALAAEQAEAAVRAALGDAPLDLIAQPRDGRRKKLLLADMDSTIVTSETLDEIAAFAGLKEQIAEITRRSMNGELDFAQALTARVAMLRGLEDTALEATWKATELTPGAAELVGTMRANGAHTALVSGGFTFFTARVAELVGFHEHHANTLLVEEGKLTGAVGQPILDRDAKLATLKRLAAQLGVPLAEAATVGDGANDLAMIQAAGLGVAFRAKPVVAAAARHRLEHADLRGLLFAQGYRAAEFRRG